jgi:hypothetical protein
MRPRTYLLLYAALLLYVGLTAVSGAGQVSEKSLIVPGQSVGKLKLGDSEDQFRNLFTWKPNVDEHNTYPAISGCPASEELHWLDAGNPPFSSGAKVHDGVSAYLRNGHIFQIEVATPLFRTADGITEDAPPAKLKLFYPNLDAFWLKHKGYSVEGSKEDIYWVDETKGIAFQLVYNVDKHRRVVHSIAVFLPSTTFSPDGCLYYPRQWQKIAPYSLELPPEK